MNWQTVENRLVIDGNDVVEFPYLIYDVKQIQDTVVVVLDVPDDYFFPRNAFGYVLSEKRLWQVGEYRHGGPGDYCRILGFSQSDIPEQVAFWTWSCFVLQTDVCSGEVLQQILYNLDSRKHLTI